VGTTAQSKIVVTVVHDLSPVVMVSIEETSDNSNEVNVYHKDTNDLLASFRQLEVARNGVGYLYWKLTGIILFDEHPEVDVQYNETPF